MVGTGTTAFAQRRMDTLSSGERQKVYIAAALAQGADIWLLDEPTTFLDYHHQADILSLVALANKEFDVTVVAVTHDLNHAVLESDRIIALREGEVAFYGTPDLIMKPDVLERIYGASLLLVDHPDVGLADDRAADDTRTGQGAGQVASELAREDEIGHGWTLGVFAGLAVLAVAWAPFWGMEHIPFSALWGGVDDYAKTDILWKLRIPRVLMAFLAGTALATSGMVFQAMFRNPLATPFTLGVSSGASLGAAVCDPVRLDLRAAGPVERVAVGLRRRAGVDRAGLSVDRPQPARLVHRHDAAGRRGRQLLLLQPDPLPAIHERLHPLVPHVALDDGGTRRASFNSTTSWACFPSWPQAA